MSRTPSPTIGTAERIRDMHWLKLILAMILIAPITVSLAEGATPKTDCGRGLTREIPGRPHEAAGGTAVMARLDAASGADRDALIVDELLSGNLPGFLRDLVPVSFAGKDVSVTICVMPDYLAVGDDGDNVRTPLGLPAAAQIADRLGFFLPTPRMVDAIYAQASLHLAPAPMKPTREMTTTRYFVTHNATIEGQLSAARANGLSGLTAGQKKDVVFCRRLISNPGRVAIYGWHRSRDKPIQPLSTVHGAQYADYSHGVRLVSATAFVNGAPVPLEDLMRDPVLAPLISSEGAFERPHALLASLYR